jgi:hypothetical protein
MSHPHMGSSLLSPLSPFYRQFGLRARYKGDSISRQDHFIFYKWFYFEFIGMVWCTEVPKAFFIAKSTP